MDEIVIFVGPRLLNIWNFVWFSSKNHQMSKEPNGLAIGLTIWRLSQVVLNTLPSPTGFTQQHWRYPSIRNQFSVIFNTQNLALTLFKILDFVCFLLFSSKYISIELPLGKELLTKRFLIFSLERLKKLHTSCLLFNLLLFNKNAMHKNLSSPWAFFFFHSKLSSCLWRAFPGYLICLKAPWGED